MKYCRHCGAQLADDDDYCYFCGKPLEEEKKEAPIFKDDTTYDGYRYEPSRPNTLAMLGLVFAFISPIVGLVLSILGLKKARLDNGNGRGMAITGIIVAILNFVFTFAIYFWLMYTYSGGAE